MPAVAPLSQAAATVVQQVNPNANINTVEHDRTQSTHVPDSIMFRKAITNAPVAPAAAAVAAVNENSLPRPTRTNLDTVKDQQVPTGL